MLQRALLHSESALLFEVMADGSVSLPAPSYGARRMPLTPPSLLFLSNFRNLGKALCF